MSLMRRLADLTSEAAALWSGEDASELTADKTIRLNELLGRIRRTTDGAQAKVAAEIARQSRSELGPDGLAKRQGFRNSTALIAATTGTTSGEAARLMRVGEAIAPRMQLNGSAAPARHPHVADALDRGAIGTSAAAAIITLLDGVAVRAGREQVEIAEKTLTEQAPGLSLDQLARVLSRAQAWLDPGGVAPREDEQRSKRFFTIREESDGGFFFQGRTDAEHGAPVKAAVEGYVAAELAAIGATFATNTQDPDATRRTIVQMQADALARICEHALGCTDNDVPLAKATVIVRIDHDDLVSGLGHATIDGIATPISVATARRMAAGGKIISCVYDAEGDILDWGRAKRVFTRTQKLALVERDGGCAMCGAPPNQTNAHHIRWWSRDAGPTDLTNGILLDTSCHHRIHDNGWEIRIEGSGRDATVWFIPPPDVNPTRTPRLGGRKRFGFAA